MIVLASKSASRKAMLDAAGVSYTTIPAELDERALEAEMAGLSPNKIAAGLAGAKAIAVSETQPGALVLGSDSLVVVEGQRFDKPVSREDAARHLRFFSGKVMHLHSAATLARDGKIIWQDDAMASLHFVDLSELFIEKYLADEWPAVAGCVGVFRIEGRGVQLFKAIEGDYFTVLGMPLLLVLGALRKFEEKTA